MSTRSYDTLKMSMNYELDNNWMPKVCANKQVIRANQPLSVITHAFDTDAVERVEIISGGIVNQPVHLRDNIYTVTIQLDTPLATGQSTELEYRDVFKSVQLPHELRYDIQPVLEALVLEVQFPNVPMQLFWAHWKGYAPQDPILKQEQITPVLKPRREVTGTELQTGVWGFYWTP